jgi:iron-sulfur cluster assembly protein
MIPVEITTAAKSHIIGMILRDGKTNVILDIVPGGCNGYEYKWTLTNDTLTENGSIDIRLSDINVLYLTKRASENMSASMITMKQDGLNRRLEIINPNVAYACGCGESVNFK